MATSADPEEAGQHVQEQFAMNQGGGGQDAGGQQPDPAAAGAAPPQAGA
jgi:hypothetical protein